MTISAANPVMPSDLLERSLELYRDLALGLRARISRLTSTGSDADVDCKGGQEAIKAHQKALQTVLDIEASLGKSVQSRGAGTSTELDLDAARAEVLARLSLWASQE
jgi:hypothetical protein